MNFIEFVKKLNKKKPFRNLSEEYKTDKFLRLYYKIYEYMESIPKEEIVIVKVKNSIFGYGLLRYIKYFLKAKDFNNWRQRIYELVTKNLGAGSFDKWKLLYNSKAEEFFREYTNKIVQSDIEYNLKTHGVKNVFELEEVKEKIRKRHLERRGVEHPAQSKEVLDKMKATSIERYGVDNYAKTKEYIEKTIATNNERYNCDWYNQTEESKEKHRITNLEKHGVISNLQICEYRSHSRIADEFCIRLYDKLPDDVKPYCIFYKKDNEEYGLRDKDRIFRYDFTISSESIKVIVEFDGIYWHGLKEGQKFVGNKTVEEVWSNDLEKTRVAERNGYVVFRVREDEYMENKDVVLNKLKDEILRYK